MTDLFTKSEMFTEGQFLNRCLEGYTGTETELEDFYLEQKKIIRIGKKGQRIVVDPDDYKKYSRIFSAWKYSNIKPKHKK